MGLGNKNTNRIYIKVIDGKFRREVEEGTEGAVARSYEIGDKSGTKHELVYNYLEGFIQDIFFSDSDYGKNFNLVVDGVQLQIKVDTRYFADLAKRLPGIDPNLEVELTPYSFEKDGKTNTGISVKQAGQKFKNFFFDGEQATHGIPETESPDDSMDKDERKLFWAAYYLKVQKFLIKFLESDFKERVKKSSHYKSSVSKPAAGGTGPSDDDDSGYGEPMERTPSDGYASPGAIPDEDVPF